MKLTGKEMDALITNDILAYEPYGSFYCVDNDGSLMSCAMFANGTTPSALDSDNWGHVDLHLVSDEERVVLEQFKEYLSIPAFPRGEAIEVQA